MSEHERNESQCGAPHRDDETHTRESRHRSQSEVGVDVGSLFLLQTHTQAFDENGVVSSPTVKENLISHQISMLRVVAVLALALTSSSAIYAPKRRNAARQHIMKPSFSEDLVAAKAPKPKPPPFLQYAYAAAGLATTAAWTTVVATTIRSNQPMGALMPSWQHQVFARTSVLSALPLVASCYASLVSASKDSWDALGSTTCRRLNLALVGAGIGSAFWVGFAPTITQIPGSSPLVSHQAYKGATRAALIGAYGSAAALSAAVWARSLPEEARKQPLTWPGRLADGVAKSLVSLGPASAEDAVNVKYSLLSTAFLTFSAIQLGSFPLAVVPSWTGRRCSRAFAAWTLLAATASFDLKEAVEGGRRRADAACQRLSTGLAGFGAVYLSAKVGAVFFDPSFPVHYKIVTMVPAAQLAASALIGLTLRPDH